MTYRRADRSYTLLMFVTMASSSIRAIGAVSCGGHFARMCAECAPTGHGAEYCHGNCHWDIARRRCIDKQEVASPNEQEPIHDKMNGDPEPAPHAGAARNPAAMTLKEMADLYTNSSFESKTCWAQSLPMFLISMMNGTEAHSPLKLISCGGHSARNCTECPPTGHGEDYCHGDCRWDFFVQRCVDKHKVVSPNRQKPRTLLRGKLHSEPEPTSGHFAVWCNA
eukprot:gnl/MRDRNA2_/MRDRNA2_73158_c0_seq1.p1 gnl/MRDRNA2_/MRDRNA2_73158_c0~~gnl/MRDRNA2_/MRDRNA2_73158_c0_seq1.p1  ORF type:complete len:223 (+),score=23.69 gnl/MRDRNA2_/MRDRNA2_73158_c0_seq1:233-901(+)